MLKEIMRALLSDRDIDWINALKRAEKDGEGVDLSALIGTQSDKWRRFDEAFSEAEIRSKSKKRFW